MHRIRFTIFRVFTILMGLQLLLAACTGSAPAPAAGTAGTAAPEAPATDNAATESAGEEIADNNAVAQEEPAGEAAAEDTTSAADASDVADAEKVAAADAALAPWQSLALTDVRTGAPFTLADFAGRTVYVEPMATWCTNCRRQLGEVQQAQAQLGEEVVFVALSVETNISAQELGTYAQENGFDWTFAVMTPEFLAALADTFGQTIANPPATPHFVIRPDGSFGDLHTGITPAAEIGALVAAN